MKKLFIFRKQLTANSVVTDSQGLNLDFLAIPADNLANISARQGEIILSFKDGNDFSDSGLSNSSSTTLRFCNVTIAVVEGKEYSVVQALWNRAYKTADATIVFDNTSDTFFNDNVLRIESIVRSESPAFASSSDVPVGGDIDQVLTKLSSADGDVDWVYPHTLFIKVRNVSGGTLQKGTPVHATGVTGNVPDVIAADASNSSAMPATYVLNEQINNNAQGVAIIVGTITGVDTSAFSAGDVVYVASGGGFTNVKPTGTNLIQNLGVVTRSNSTTGSGVVYGSGRSNDVPNLPTGKFFIGSATNTLESAYTLPTADGTSGQVLATNGSGAVTFQDAASGKYTLSVSYRYYAGTANYYVGNSTLGFNTTGPTYTLASIASCTAIDVFNTGMLIPFNLSNVGFKIYGYSSGNTRTVDFELLKGTVTASGALKTDSISLTTVASNTGFTMTSNTEMYDISATSTNSVSAGDFLMLAFKGSTGSFYYFTVTIYGDT